MKTTKKILLAFVFFSIGLLLFWAGRIYGKEDSSPGSDGDPIITKSYLDLRLGNLGDKGGASGSNFKKVRLKKGSRLLAEEGSLLLVYKGNGSVIGSDGLINTSHGVLFKRGDSLVKYHVFLSPSEGSGILAKDRMTIFLSGSYQITN